jgi:hypothetical protein
VSSREEELQVLGLGSRKREKSEKRIAPSVRVRVHSGAESVAVPPRHRVRVKK